MPAVLLVVAPCTESRTVVDMLRDWSALGLLRPYLTIESGDVDPGSSHGDIVVTEVRHGATTRRRLLDALADGSASDLVRVVAVSNHGRKTTVVPGEVGAHLAQGLQSGGRFSPLHCHITRFGEDGWDPAAVWRGWHNVVLSPEDSWAPSTRPTILSATSSEEEFLAHAACTLAGVAGLWAEAPGAPFDGERPPTDSEVVAVRAFVRSLDASAVGAALRTQVTDTTAGLPLPRTAGVQSRRLSSPDASADRMCRGVLDKHAALLDVRYQRSTEEVTQKIGAIEAIRRFLAFLGASLRRAPGDLVRRGLQTASARAARTLQDAIYGGDNSRYDVVVRGVTARRTAVPAGDLVRGAEEVAQRVNRVLRGAEHHTPDVAPLWQDLLGGGLALADAGERVSGVPLQLVDQVPGVVTDVESVVPDPDQPHRLPRRVAAFMGTGEVHAHDVRAQDQVAEWFATVEDDVDNAHATEDFERWRERTGRSYAGHISSALAALVRRRNAELAGLLERLARSTSDAAGRAAVEQATRKARRLLLVGLLVLLGIVVAVVAVALLALLPILAIVAIGLALAVSWVVGVTVGLVRRQQQIYALLNQRSKADDEATLSAENLRVAAEGLYVAGVLYAQSLVWLPLLGRFLRAPFGSAPTPPPAPRLDARLPRALGLARAVPESEKLPGIALELSAELFHGGWLGPLWERFLAEAGERLAADGLLLSRDAATLFRDRAETGSPLQRWAAIVAAEGISGAGGELLWENLQRKLHDRPDLARRLVARTELVGQEDHRRDDVVTAADVVGELVQSLSAPSEYDFVAVLFDESQRHYAPQRVQATAFGGNVEVPSPAPGVAALHEPRAGSGLDRFLVVVQRSSAVAPEHLRLRDQVVAAPAPGPDGTSADIGIAATADETLEKLQSF